MKFNFQKNEYDRVHFERDFSFKEFYEKVLPIYKNVEKNASPQFQQSQLKSQNQTINFKNIAFIESITLDYDDNFSNKMVQDLLERLRSLGLAGSPPHVRVILWGNTQYLANSRITPACAGNTVC